jgi:predicted secreted acid phosphatase
MVTNLEPTKQNLEALDVLGASDIFLLRQNMSDTKEIRRQEIINGTGRMKKVGPLNIVAYLGDQSGDFPDERVEEFGIKYFLFPNPMYGKW